MKGQRDLLPFVNLSPCSHTQKHFNTFLNFIQPDKKKGKKSGGEGVSGVTLALPTLFYCLIAFTKFFEFCIAADTLSPGQSITGVQTLISSGQIFELGFFSSGNNNSR